MSKKPKKSAEFSFDAKKIPTDSGCYLFKNDKGEILYIGKAKNLRKRVSSYFQKTAQAPKTYSLVKKVRDIETRTVQSEMEALILENNLIKEHMPKYNVLLRDDKNFLYLRITKDDLPKLEITRRLVRDGSTYIGPRTSAKSFRSTIAFCQKFFGAKMVDSAKDNYISKLKGTQISDETYRQNIKQMIKFLRGDTKEVLVELQNKMMGFAKDKNFEAAARTRDLIESIQGSAEKQIVEVSDDTARDFIGLFREKSAVFLVRLVFRNGKFIDQSEIKLRAEEWHEETKILADFLLQFYPQVDHLPKEIVTKELPEDTDQIISFLTKKFLNSSHKLEIKIAQKGDKKKILELAEKNAENFATKTKVESMSQAETFSKSLPELTKALDLKKPPRRIECYDISHFAGQETVASQVVFIDGAKANSEYRRYKLKTLETGEIDDFKSMQEVITRRFSGTKKEVKKSAKKKPSNPDLVIIDGGKGQLSSVLKVFTENKELVPKGFKPNSQIIALAKREEEVFRGKKLEQILLDRDSAASKLLQRIRDEAHRFAISYNKNLRSKSLQKSILDDIGGIGSKTKKKLLTTFGSPQGIRDANDEQLLEIVNQKQLENIRKQL